MIRPFQPQDLTPMTQLTNRGIEADTGKSGEATTERLSRFLGLGKPDTKCLVAALPDATVVGYCSLHCEVESGELRGHGQVDPDYRRQGFGTQLLHAAEARGLELAAGVQSVTSFRTARDHEIGTVALLKYLSYELARTQTYMERALSEPIEIPPLPAEIALRDFDPQRDSRAIYDAHQESFRPTQVHGDTPYSEWEQSLLRHPYFDPTLWLIAVDGDEIAGIALNFAVSTGYTMSNLAVLGVRERWQRRGLGRALLLRSLHLLRERGFQAVGLLVDADNRRNAFGLYESVGMHVGWQRFVYSKKLR